MSQVLVDTSVWVEMFREADSPPARRLGDLLGEGLVCTHGLVKAELLSGARSEGEYRTLEDGLSALDLLPDPPELWEDVARSRFLLARGGFQAGIADLILAVTASFHGKTLFSLDRAFGRIKTAVPVKLLAA